MLENVNICSICLDEMHYDIHTTCCGHKFHKKCLLSSIKKCPLCRYYIGSNNDVNPVNMNNNSNIVDISFFFSTTHDLALPSVYLRYDPIQFGESEHDTRNSMINLTHNDTFIEDID